ncbi:MAG: ABC transporter ATP-binding protein [Candidatus Theseobacter exili]|nr:ABC transporter ATP-binding protein [Candidatus Theseobacter exili]
MSTSATTLIRLESIHKFFQTGLTNVHALDGIDLTINENEFFAILGPSGSGKSTLLHVIGCLTSPSKGTYLLNGSDVSGLGQWNLAQVRNHTFGFVFQSFSLLSSLNVLDNVCVPLIYGRIHRKERHRLARDVIGQVGLSHREHHFPGQLSGGEQQRVAIARALVSNPSVILADEPTGNLDSASGDEIMRILKTLQKQGRTVIIVTHDEHIAQNAQREIHIVDGQISVKGQK